MIKKGGPSQAQAGEVSGGQGQLGAGPGEASNGKSQRSGLTSSLRLIYKRSKRKGMRRY